MSRCIEYRNATLWRTKDGFWWLYVITHYPGRGGNRIPMSGATAVFSSKADARSGLRLHKVIREARHV